MLAVNSTGTELLVVIKTTNVVFAVTVTVAEALTVAVIAVAKHCIATL